MGERPKRIQRKRTAGWRMPEGAAVKPILFSGPMVRAILREVEAPGTGKTQTRRIIPPGNIYDGISSEAAEDFERRGWETCWHGEELCAAMLRWQAGDVLWCREAWRAWWEYNDTPPSQIPTGADLQYVADDPLSPWDTRLRPGIHMPRWASRLTMTVEEVRVERLQDISEADAKAEGWERADWRSNDPAVHRDAARDWFSDLWGDINGTGSWAANPFVAVLRFTPHLINVDAYLTSQAALANDRPLPKVMP